MNARHARRNFASLFLMVGVLLGSTALVACEKKQPASSNGSSTSTTTSPAATARATPVTPVSSPTPRIVVLSPALAAVMQDLGLEPAIVGRHGWDIALPSSLPVCGDQAGVDLEALLKVQPTHIVIQWGERELPTPLVALADARSWTIINLNPLALDDIVGVTRELNRVFAPAIEHQAASERAKATLANLEAACARKDEAVWNGRVLLLAATNPAAALGPGSWHADVLDRMGGVGAISQGKAYQTLDAEDLIRLAPQGIVLIQPRAASEPALPARNVVRDMELAELSNRLGPIANLDLPAIRTGRVAIIDEPLALTPGTSIIQFRQRLREILKAWKELP